MTLILFFSKHTIEHTEDALLEDLAGTTAQVIQTAAAEDAARTSKERFRSIYEETAMAIAISELDGRFINVNPAFSSLLGYSAEDLPGLTLSEVIHPDDLERLLPFLKRCGDGEIKNCRVEARMAQKRGNRIDVNLTITAMQNEEGKSGYLVVVIDDLTDRRRMAAEMGRVQKLESVGALAGGIAHDFNNLLMIIMGHISLSKMEVSPESSVASSLARAEKACLQAKNLTQQLLIFSKGGKPVKRSMEIGKLVRESTTFALSGSKHTARFDIPNNLSPVEADAGQLIQVINNLVMNADQAMADAGDIEVGIENMELESSDSLPLKKGKYLRIMVRDHGIGIPPKEIAQIFDPYFTTKQKGTGLGLSIAYAVVNRHGGRITVDSTMGKGSTFYVYLPVTEKEVEARQESPDDIVAGEGRILIMDDDSDIRIVIGGLIERLGYEVVEAADGGEAIEIYQREMEAGNPFDIVVMDLTIPGGMGGKTAIQELQRIDPAVKAIVSSGYSTDAVMANYSDYGFSGVIPKPFQLKEISALLHRVISGQA